MSTFVPADWSITRNGAALDVRYIGDAHAGASPSYVSGINLHRAIQDFADNDNDSGDDEVSIITENPSDRAGADTNIVFLNGCNIDQTASEHVFDTSIVQADGDEIYDGIQVFGNSNTIQIIQDGAVLANDFWNEAKMITATEDAASTTSHRFILLVRDAGADIDGRRLVGTQRELGTIYSEFTIGGGTQRGNNSLPLTANTDINNTTIAGTIATWTDIVNDTEGYVGIDADGNTTDEFYYSDWELGSRSKNEFYERAKWIQREGTSETLYGLDGDVFRGITHEIDIDTPTGTFSEPEALSWSGGTGQLLAIDSTTAGTKMWIQLLTGVIPADNATITGGTSSATADVNVTVTPQVVPSTFVGVSTGSAIIGAFGLGIGADDLTQNDLVTDLTGTANTPPNNVTFTVNNTVSGDKVLVGPEDGAGGLDLDQMTTNATYSGAAVTSIQMTATIPDNTPATGTIRVELDDGDYLRIVYSSYTTDTFTITSTDFSTVNSTSGNNAFVSYIDRTATGTSETFTTVFDSAQTLFVRDRNATALIKPFDTTSDLGAGGGAATVSRISDA